MLWWESVHSQQIYQGPHFSTSCTYLLISMINLSKGSPFATWLSDGLFWNKHVSQKTCISILKCLIQHQVETSLCLRALDSGNLLHLHLLGQQCLWVTGLGEDHLSPWPRKCNTIQKQQGLCKQISSPYRSSWCFAMKVHVYWNACFFRAARFRPVERIQVQNKIDGFVLSAPITFNTKDLPETSQEEYQQATLFYRVIWTKNGERERKEKGRKEEGPCNVELEQLPHHLYLHCIF